MRADDLEGGGLASVMRGGESRDAALGALPPGAWLVLALVIEKPSHGYEIDRRYEARFGAFLPLSTSRVYEALRRLNRMGLIERIALRPEGHSRKQHGLRQSYRAKRAGVQAYRGWAAERMRDDPQRVEILARVASVGLLGVDALVDVVDGMSGGVCRS